MAFGREMQHRARTMEAEQVADYMPVDHVSLYKLVAAVRRNLLEVTQVAGIGQLVKIDDRSSKLRYPLQDEVRADEAGPTGN